jgi:uridine nucleosidase
MLNGPSDKKHDSSSKTKKNFLDHIRVYMTGYRKNHDLDGPPHDPLVVAAILDHEGIEDIGFDYSGGEHLKIDLITEGGQLGRPVVTKLPAGQEGVRIPRGLDVPEFWRVLEQALSFVEHV